MLVNQKINDSAFFEMCSEDQIALIHYSALEILERTGIVVHDDEALKLYKEGGALVNGNKVRIPTWMVEEALRTVPSNITLATTSGKRDMHLHENTLYFGTGTDLPNFQDRHTREIRPVVYEDVINAGKIIQSCDNIDYTSSMGLPSDVDQRLVDLYNFKAMRMYCDKPNLTLAVNEADMKGIIDMAAESAGGYKELANSPTLLAYSEPVSPLVFGKDAVRKMLLCAEYAIPQTWATGITAGGTGPMTHAACLTVGTAESLAGLVLQQLKRKGAPFMFGIVYSAMDMKTTTSPYGTPEASLGHAVVGQLGRFYNLPTFGIGGCTDSNRIDAQAGLESMFLNLVAALAGTNFVHDNGYMGSGLHGSYETILLNDDIIGYIKHFMKGIEISDETLALDVIHQVGHGGEFISHPHTFKTFRKEIYDPKYLNRAQLMAWKMGGCKDIQDILNEHVNRIIDSEMKPMLTEHEIKVYDEIIEEQKSKLGEY